MKSFNKTYGLKLSDSEINQIVKDSTKTIEQSLAKTNVPQTMDEVLKTINAMTDKQVEELIKKVRMSQPPGITQSVWSSIVDSFVSSGKNTNKLAANSGQSVGKWAMNGIFSIYKKGLTLAIFYQGGKFLLNPLVPNDTNTVSELAKRSLLWPIYFWKGLKDTESTIQTSLQAPSTSLDAGGKMNYGTNPSQPSQTTTQTSSPELFKKGEFDN
jgi:hypothetical protein